MHRRRQAVSVHDEKAAMSRDPAERWLDLHDPSRRPKPATAVTFESPLEGVPARTVKIEEAG
jgi:hypothetical protein